MKTNKYLSNVYCPRHNNEKLNFVCTHRKCSFRGLICQLCKGDDEQQHISHIESVVPFKYFIESLELNIEDVNVDLYLHNESGISTRIQKVKHEIMARFYHTIQQMARIAEDFEKRIIDDYEKKVDTIKNKSLVNRQVKKIIDKCLLHNIKKEEKFQLMNEIKNIIGQIDTRNIPGQNIKFGIDFRGKNLLADYVTQLQGIKTYCDRIQLIFIKFFGNEEDKSKQSAFLNHLDMMQKQESQIYEKKVQQKHSQHNINPASPDLKLIQKNKNIFESKMNEKIQKSEDNKQQIVKHKNLMKQISSKIKKQTQKIAIADPKYEINKEITGFMNNISKLTEIQKPVYPKEIIFSNLIKSQHIKLMKSGLGAQKSETGLPNKGFVLISHPLQLCKKISFRIMKLKTDIHVGIANIEEVKSSKFTLAENKSGKGLFLKSAKGKTIGSSIKQSQLTPFNFNQKSIITLTYQSQILSFHQSTANKKKNSIWDNQLDITANIQGKQSLYSFCVFLEGSGDHIQIV